MEFTIKKEQILELSKINAVIKESLNEAFPEAFKTELEVGNWYKDADCLGKYAKFNYQGGKRSDNYGWNRGGEWRNDMGNVGNENAIPMTPEEVEEAFIAEAKKRGYKEGVKCAFGEGKYERKLETNDIVWNGRLLSVKHRSGAGDIIFHNGRWAEILPEEKTVITKEKALKILAKKLKVSPENIEIEA